MSRIRTALLIVAVAAGLAAAADTRENRPPSEIIRPAAALSALEAKFDWALGKAPKPGPGRIFWIGYSVDRLMGENTHIGSYSVGGRGRDLTVAEVLAGKKNEAAPADTAEDVRRAARRALDDIDSRPKPVTKVLKELGFFFRYEAGKTPVLAEVHMTNLDLPFDFETAPLFWLGKAPEGQSLALVKALYGLGGSDKVRRSLVAATGCHGTAGLVIPILAGVLAGDGSDNLRRDAAFWIGQQNDPESLRILVKAARTDTSKEVREGAVFSISQVELPAAVDQLIALARSAEPRDVRKQAVFWIGQMASEKSGKALEEFARKDGDIEIQEQAVFALSQLPDNQGVEPLIKLAKTHPDPRIRKKAVFWLGECDDPRALETLIAIIKGK
jgi:HEAT repeat protein